MKAAGLGASFTPEDAGIVGDLLTSRHPDSSGNMKSALDAPELLAAIGVNKGKLNISEDFTPGYAISKVGAVQGGVAVEKSTEDACNAIMSPSAMYSAMAADAVITAATFLTVVGGIAKVIASWAISEMAVKAVGLLIENVAMDVISDLAQNDKIPTAKGIKFGSILGISAMVLFSSGGMARHLPTLKISQLAQFDEIRLANEQFNKEMEIASLSPLDTSSRHTFLGSIVHNLGTTMIANGTHTGSILSTITNLARLPLTALSFSSSVDAATNISATYCGYAEEFGLTTPNPADVPAINAAGLPCTGLTSTQDSMTTEQAIDYLANEEWLDISIDVAENATIDDLLTTGVIKPETPFADFITACSDASSGDYMFNSAGCTVGDAGDVSNVTNVSTECITQEDGSALCATDSEEFANSTELAPLGDAKALSAISVFLLDYQILQSINGEDESEEVANEPTDSVAGLPDAVGNIVSPIPDSAKSKVVTTARYGKYPKGGDHFGIDLAAAGDNSWDFVSVCDGVVSSVDINQRYANRNAYKTRGSTNYVWVKCDNGVYMGYAHFYANKLRSYITPGYRISAGTPIAPQGDQGNSSGPHLHFQVNPLDSSGYDKKSTVDPAAYLQRLGVSLPKASY